MSEKEKEKQVPNYTPSGNLVAEGCMFRGIFLKWDEPPDMHTPKLKWKIYVFKGEEAVDKPIPIYRQPGYLFGRDSRIADIRLMHPSASSQHAVLYFRKLTITGGEEKRAKNVIKPFIMDLKSVNGTLLNKERIEPYKYYEIKQGDLINFGQSSRDYVFLPEESVGLAALGDDASDSEGNDGEGEDDMGEFTSTMGKRSGKKKEVDDAEDLGDVIDNKGGVEIEGIDELGEEGIKGKKKKMEKEKEKEKDSMVIEEKKKRKRGGDEVDEEEERVREAEEEKKKREKERRIKEGEEQEERRRERLERKREMREKEKEGRGGGGEEDEEERKERGKEKEMEKKKEGEKDKKKEKEKRRKKKDSSDENEDDERTKSGKEKDREKKKHSHHHHHSHRDNDRDVRKKKEKKEGSDEDEGEVKRKRKKIEEDD